MHNRRTNPWLVLTITGLIAVLVPLVILRAFNGRKDDPAHETLTNSIGMTLVRVPPGRFLMGSPEGEEGRGDDEGPQHEVEITRPFFMGAYEVTQAEYERLMGEEALAQTGTGRRPSSHRPVENVSWDEAAEFCRRLSELPGERSAGRSYRLPTEAEWEYACRAGTATPFAFGDVLSQRQANFTVLIVKDSVRRRFSLDHPAGVGSYRPNAFGLYDMHGNVWEWCQDWYDPLYYRNSPAQDPQGPSGGEFRVARGGSWNDRAVDCRSARRLALAPGIRLGNGFRVVMVERQPR